MRFPSIFTFALLSAFASLDLGACSPTVPEMESLARRDRKIEEAYVRTLFAASDHVVVGTVVEVKDSTDPIYMQVAVIEVERVLKGPPQALVSALMYKKSESTKTDETEDDARPMEEVVSCGSPYEPERDDPYIIETARGLFYVREGILKRVNSFVIEPQLLLHDTDAELNFLSNEVR